MREFLRRLLGFKPKKEVYILRQGQRKRKSKAKVIRGTIVDLRCSRKICSRDNQSHSPLTKKELRKGCLSCPDLEFVIVVNDMRKK